MMKTILLGFSRLRRYRLSLFLLCVLTDLFLWTLFLIYVAQHRPFLNLLCFSSLSSVLTLRLVWRFGQDPNAVPSQLSPVSNAVPTENAPVSMHVVARTDGDSRNLLRLPDFRVPVETLRVVFYNGSGETIQTDTSFALESKIDGRWRTVAPIREAAAPAPLEIPCGESEKITFTLLGCYDGLYQGEYRVIKTVACGGESLTLAAPFTID